jgi:hypothetical protein
MAPSSEQRNVELATLEENPKEAVEELEVLPVVGPEVIVVTGTFTRLDPVILERGPRKRFEAMRRDLRRHRAFVECVRPPCPRLERHEWREDRLRLLAGLDLACAEGAHIHGRTDKHSSTTVPGLRLGPCARSPRLAGPRPADGDSTAVEATDARIRDPSPRLVASRHETTATGSARQLHRLT